MWDKLIISWYWTKQTLQSTLDVNGTVTGTSCSGSVANLMIRLNASNISSGTLDVSRKLLLVLRGTETQAHSLAHKEKKDEKYVPKEADEKKKYLSAQSESTSSNTRTKPCAFP